MYYNQYRRSEPFSCQPTVLNIYPTADWIAESARILAHDVEKTFGLTGRNCSARHRPMPRTGRTNAMYMNILRSIRQRASNLKGLKIPTYQTNLDSLQRREMQLV